MSITTTEKEEKAIVANAFEKTCLIKQCYLKVVLMKIN